MRRSANRRTFIRRSQAQDKVFVDGGMNMVPTDSQSPPSGAGMCKVRYIPLQS